MNTKNIASIIAMAFAIMLLGCVKEDLSICHKDGNASSYLTFEYTMNSDYVDKFADAVSTLDVFVFDDNLDFISVISSEEKSLKAENYKMMLELPDGTYTFVVWGGARNSYRAYNTEFDIVPLAEGMSGFERCKLVLNDDQSFEDTDDLFHGIARNVRICSKQLSHTHISLIKNTNNINVTVTGISGQENNNRIDIICSAANSEYRFDNSVKNKDLLKQYISVKTVGENEINARFKTLRLLTGMKSHLIVRDADSGLNIIEHNLIDLIKLLPDIRTDEDLDRNDVYNIEIDLHTDMSASVIINGYKVISSN